MIPVLHLCLPCGCVVWRSFAIVTALLLMNYVSNGRKNAVSRSVIVVLVRKEMFFVTGVFRWFNFPNHNMNRCGFILTEIVRRYTKTASFWFLIGSLLMCLLCLRTTTVFTSFIIKSCESLEDSKSNDFLWEVATVTLFTSSDHKHLRLKTE